jgi:hypothetical protein|tara:strand:- start:102 stop:245 length:144 start_codon:yes stop_codon:yes gene_type:complete
MDSLKVSALSFANYGIHLANINLILQLVVGIMTIIYLGYKIKNIRSK